MKIYVPPHRLGDMGVGIGIFVCVFARLFVWLVGLFVCVVAAFGGPSGPGGGALESNASASAGI